MQPLNEKAIKAGYYFGETAELFPSQYEVAPAKLKAGKYRRFFRERSNCTLGLTTAATKANKSLVYASYPITPASDVLHGLARLKHFGIRTFQAEDEIAAVMVALGASFTGDIGVTGTSGPGLALKAEAIGLAVMMELPLIVVNVQRAGPSTGMPTQDRTIRFIAKHVWALWRMPSDCGCSLESWELFPYGNRSISIISPCNVPSHFLIRGRARECS